MSIVINKDAKPPNRLRAPVRVEPINPTSNDFGSPYRGCRGNKAFSCHTAGSRGNAGPACLCWRWLRGPERGPATAVYCRGPGSTPGRQHCLLTGVVTVEDRGTAPLTPIRASDLSVANDVSARIRQCRETDQLAPVNKTAGTTRYCDDARRPSLATPTPVRGVACDAPDGLGFAADVWL